MKPKDKLHILNGQVMYEHVQKSRFLKDEVMVPFNEAMCYGETIKEIFSNKFIRTRAKVHHVTVNDYIEVALKPLQPLFDQQFRHIELWFDEDMFCQINILTILGWLDQENYLHTIKLHIIDRDFRLVKTFALKAQGYHKIYTQVLVNKITPKQIQLAHLKRGIELYLANLEHNR